MVESVIKRQLVWPASIRVTHGVIALSVFGLLITGTILQHLPDWYYVARDFHYIFAYSLTLALVSRLFILFSSRNNAASWREFVPGSRAKANIIAMLRFYLSFTRTPLPNWYAHNPLWLPLYLLLYLSLIVQSLTGYLLASSFQFTVLDINLIHHHLTLIIFWFTVIHIFTVILHDIKGTSSDISAMLNGYRIFVIDKPSQDLLGSTSQKVTFPPTYSSPDKKPNDKP